MALPKVEATGSSALQGGKAERCVAWTATQRVRTKVTRALVKRSSRPLRERFFLPFVSLQKGINIKLNLKKLETNNTSTIDC